MKTLLLLDIRELRSFKLRHTLQFYNKKLKNSESTLAFFLADSLYPEERIQFTEQLLNHKLSVTFMSKKINRVLFNFLNESSVGNLLKGQVFVVESLKKELFMLDALKDLIFSNKFCLRLVISQTNLYRKSRILSLMDQKLTFPRVLSSLSQKINLGNIALLTLTQTFNRTHD